MATRLLPGITTWHLQIQRDESHNRDYTVEFKVLADREDGPATVANTAGLPLPGSAWAFGNDLDPAATCKADWKIEPVQSGDENTYLWRVQITYSTKPDKRCQDFKFEDPLTEPQKISGSWTKYKEEITQNRFKIPLKYSSHERIKGPLAEFDTGLPTVRIEQNVLNLDLPGLGIALHSVNSVDMWGLPPRCVKLSGVSWSQEFYGNCYPYYKRILEFEINANTFDRDVADEGTKVLYGRWEKPGVWRLLCIDGDLPDHKNPSHFVEFKFPSGNQGKTFLNGKGLPAGVCVIWDECVGAHALSPRMTLCPEEINPALRELTTTGSFSPYYISMWDNNKGNSLQDDQVWLNVVGSPTAIGPWIAFRIYGVGSLVTHKDHTWLAWADSKGVEPEVNTTASITMDDGTTSTIRVDGNYWIDLGRTTSTGTSPDHAVDDKGVYNPCTTYHLGDYVIESNLNRVITGTATHDYSGCDKTRAGKIHIEYYAETNLFTLGLPLTIG